MRTLGVDPSGYSVTLCCGMEGMGSAERVVWVMAVLVDVVAPREGTEGRGHATPGSHFCLFEAQSDHSFLAARLLPRP